MNFGHKICPWKWWKISEISMTLASLAVVAGLRFILSLEIRIHDMKYNYNIFPLFY